MLLPIPTLEQLIHEYYRFLLDECGYEVNQTEPMVDAFAEVVTFLPERPMRVIHIGCGQGELLVFLASKFPGAIYRGVDADTTKIAMARHLADRLEVKVDWREGLLADLELPSSYFNLMIVEGLGGIPTEQWAPTIEESVRITASEGHWMIHHLHRRGETVRFCPGKASVSLLELGVGTCLSFCNHKDGSESIILKGVKRDPFVRHPSEAHA